MHYELKGLTKYAYYRAYHMKKCKKKVAKYIPSLSPLLYIISIDVLAVNLLALPNIVGLRLPINVPSCLPVLSLYADYTSVITSSDDAIRAFFFLRL